MIQSQWDDRVKILQWNEALAKQAGVVCACNTAHVKQLVAHWMATGNLNYPFAWTERQPRSLRSIASSTSAKAASPELSGAVQLSELAVHRETLRRVLEENPYSLASVLEALVSGLSRYHTASTVGSFDEATQEEELQLCPQ
jgi:hypothetical protein